jgi:hypothetical protein
MRPWYRWKAQREQHAQQLAWGKQVQDMMNRVRRIELLAPDCEPRATLDVVIGMDTVWTIELKPSRKMPTK